MILIDMFQDIEDYLDIKLTNHKVVRDEVTASKLTMMVFGDKLGKELRIKPYKPTYMRLSVSIFNYEDKTITDTTVDYMVNLLILKLVEEELL